MQLSRTLPGNPVRALRAMLLLFVIFYLCFHAIRGDRGILAWFKANRELEALTTELQEAKAKRDVVSKRIALLSGPDIDSDMLDEQARRVLGFAGENEVVILQPAAKP